MIFAWSVITIETTDQASICQRSVKKIAHFVSAKATAQYIMTRPPTPFAGIVLDIRDLSAALVFAYRWSMLKAGPGQGVPLTT
ncbi:hypothetical protein ACIAIL_17785 [Raoultella ornithinolytica]|uniref:hypothetical protein n=1 Tax=Raoultella ornithinolytica TaxID=54291 RepID=UPI003D6F3618